jgi:hypothetical protein
MIGKTADEVDFDDSLYGFDLDADDGDIIPTDDPDDEPEENDIDGINYGSEMLPNN